jgi:hypothetical protein
VLLTTAAVAAVALGGACSAKPALPKSEAIARDRTTVPGVARHLLEPFQLGIQRWSIEARVEAPDDYQLSLYTQPARTESVDVYAQRFAPLAAGVIPALFERYPDITWIDLCQEQAGTTGGDWEPTPVTRIQLTRAAADAVDWPHADIATLVARNRDDPRHLQIEAHFGITATPAWRAAIAKVRASDD